jgi:hypothetical protein
MSRREQHALAVQLFPFLAVLVCVMGALIFLLLVTTRRMHAVAYARALAEQFQQIVEPESVAPPPIEPEPLPRTEAEPAPRPVPSAEPDPLVVRTIRRDELLTQLTARVQDRNRQAATVAQRQRLIAEEQQREVELLAELKRLEQRWGAVAGQTSAAKLSTPEVDAERKLLEQQLLGLRRRLKQLQDQQRAAEGKFSLIPFDGKSGTTRRPILIECTDTGFRFLSEDVLLRPTDIEGFTPRINPLLAGAAALSAYWNQRAGKDVAEEPYVLLVVRPSGTVAFYIAQRLLSQLKQPFGYELVAEGVPLSAPATDAGAKAACEAAILQLMSQRGQLAAPGGPVPGGAGPPGANRNGGSGASRGSKGSVPQPGHAPQRNGFDVADLETPEPGVGAHSWEHPERFEGQEHRRSEGTANAAPQPKAAGEPPRTLAESATPDSSQPRNPVESPATGADENAAGGAPTPPVTTAEFLEPELPPFAARKASRASDRALPYEQLQRRRWGRHGAQADIGLEHEVRIRVEARRLIVDDQYAIPVPSGISRTDLFDRLLSVVDRQAHTWDQAPAGFFWIPNLKFTISPGGGQVYDKLSPLVTKSGLHSTAEHILEQPAPARTK